MPKRRSHYRGVFPPSLVFLLAVLAGVGMNVLLPLPLLPGSLIRIIAGGVILLGGLVLFVLAWREFRKKGEVFAHRYSTEKIISTGPYGISRHPAYLAYLLMGIGFGLLRDNVWVLVFLPIAFQYVNAGTARREERYLISKFDENYKRYRMQVRRWL